MGGIVLTPGSPGALLAYAQTVGQPYTLGKSAAGFTAPLDTVENILATVNVPILGIHSILRVETLWSFTNSANAKNLRWRLGGIGGTAFLDATQTANLSYSDFRAVRNRGATNVQVAWAAAATAGGHSASTAAVTLGAIDTSVATTLVLTGQKVTGAESLVLESYHVELIY